MKFTASGEVTFVGSVEEFRKFKKIQFAISVDDKTDLAFELQNADVDACPSLGSFVEIDYQVKSNFWEKGNKYFTSLMAKDIRYVNGATPQQKTLADENKFGNARVKFQDEDIPF